MKFFRLFILILLFFSETIFAQCVSTQKNNGYTFATISPMQVLKIQKTFDSDGTLNFGSIYAISSRGQRHTNLKVSISQNNSSDCLSNIGDMKPISEAQSVKAGTYYIYISSNAFGETLYYSEPKFTPSSTPTPPTPVVDPTDPGEEGGDPDTPTKPDKPETLPTDCYYMQANQQIDPGVPYELFISQHNNSHTAVSFSVTSDGSLSAISKTNDIKKVCFSTTPPNSLTGGNTNCPAVNKCGEALEVKKGQTVYSYIDTRDVKGNKESVTFQLTPRDADNGSTCRYIDQSLNIKAGDNTISLNNAGGRYLAMKLNVLEDGTLTHINSEAGKACLSKNPPLNTDQANADCSNVLPNKGCNSSLEVKKNDSVYYYIDARDIAITNDKKVTLGLNTGNVSSSGSCKKSFGTAYLPYNPGSYICKSGSHGYCAKLISSGDLYGYYEIIASGDGEIKVGSDFSNTKVKIAQTKPSDENQMCPIIPANNTDSIQAKAGESYYVYYKTGGTANIELFADLIGEVIGPTEGDPEVEEGSSDIVPTTEEVTIGSVTVDNTQYTCTGKKDDPCPAELAPPVLALPPKNDGSIRGYVNTFQSAKRYITLKQNNITCNGLYTCNDMTDEFLRNTKWQTNVPCVENSISPKILQRLMRDNPDGIYLKNYICDAISTKDRIRFGGAGNDTNYINGNFSMTGAGVIKQDANGYTNYVKDNNEFSFNSNSAKLYLPPHIKSKDIVFARLYWSGFSESTKYVDITSEDNKKLIKGYRDIKIKADNLPIKSLTVTNDSDIKYVYSGDTPARNYNGKHSASIFIYSNSYDVLDYIKEAVEKSSDPTSINITAGDILARANGNTLPEGVRSEEKLKEIRYGTRWMNGSFDPLSSNTWFGTIGGSWSLVVVFDKKENDIGNKEEYDKYYKYKAITIYDGLSTSMGPADGYTEFNSQFDFNGFFTPAKPKYEAKLGIYSFGEDPSGYSGLVNSVKVLNANNNTYENPVGKNNKDAEGGTSVRVFNYKDNKFEDLTGTTNSMQSIDMYDITDFMKPSQKSTSVKLKNNSVRVGNENIATMNFMNTIVFTTEVYVPELCYDDRILNSKGWLKFFDYKTGESSVTMDPSELTSLDIRKTGASVVPNEQLYYRVKFKNEGDENAIETNIKIGFSETFNTYKENSSRIDNSQVTDDFTKTDLKFILDNEIGAYEKYADIKSILDGKSASKIGDALYKDKQYNTFIDKELNFYIGKNAGNLINNKPQGGIMEHENDNSVFVDFNVSAGWRYVNGQKQKTYVYTPLKYFVGYKIASDNPNQPDIDFTSGVALPKCKGAIDDTITRILPLNGLKVVNQNYKDTDGEQNDRLFTQVAELEFDTNLIFKPDFSDMIECLDQTEVIEVIDDGSDISIDPDDEDDPIEVIEPEIIDVDKPITKKTSVCAKYDILFGEDFGIVGKKGKITLEDGTVIDGGLSVKDKLMEFTLPGELYLSVIKANDISGCKNITNDYKIPFSVNGSSYNYDYKLDFKDKKIMSLKNIKIDDAFDGVSFMLSYYPDGVQGSSEAVVDKPEGEEYEDKLERDKALEFFFGTEVSNDGAYHVCNSDAFVVRPAYFQADKTKITKYARFIDTNKVGDISKTNEVVNADNLRLAGDYKDNNDISTNVFYAKSINNNFVPNYDTIIGNDTIEKRYQVREYDSDVRLSKVPLEARIIEKKTLLKPFISNQCRAVIPQSIYVDKNLKNPQILADSDPMKYHGVEVNDKNQVIKFNLTDSANFGNLSGTFDVDNKRIWDKDAVSLIANFTDQSSKKYDSLRSQAIKQAKDKKDSPAILSTPRVTTDDALNKEIFNYYNVGDVLISLYDNSWTSSFGDQIWDTTYGMADCVLNSTSNVHNSDGLVGCDVGMENNKSLVLRYKPKRIEISVKGFSNSVNSATGSIPFTYYHSAIPNLDSELNSAAISSGSYNGALVKNINSLAQLEFNATAYIGSSDSNSINNSIIATLYDGSRLIDYSDTTYTPEQKITNSVPLCGFASDINFDVSFLLDCDTNPSDPRCYSKLASVSKTEAVSYYPYLLNTNSDVSNITKSTTVGKSYVNFLNPVNSGSFDIKADPCYLAPFDPRCFKMAVRSNSSSGKLEFSNQVKPLPLIDAINLYSLADRSGGVVNRKNSNNVFDAKGGEFVLLDSAFRNGKADGALAYVNFDRFQKIPNRPIVVTLNDFDIDSSSIVGKIQPTKFDNIYDIVDTKGKKLDGESIKNGNFMFANDSERFENFNTADIEIHSSNFYENYKAGGVDLLDANSALKLEYTPVVFVYGKVNHESDGDQSNGITSEINKGNLAEIYSALYCATTNNCKASFTAPANITSKNDLTSMILANSRTIFDDLAGVNVASNPSNGWLKYDKLDLNAAQTDIFALDYKAEKPGVNLTPPAQITAGKGELTIDTTSDAKVETKIRVFSEPWLIYTPETEEITYSATSEPTTFYNYFYFNFDVPQAGWAGEGWADGKVDEVGEFIMKKDIERKRIQDRNKILMPRIEW